MDKRIRIDGRGRLFFIDAIAYCAICGLDGSVEFIRLAAAIKLVHAELKRVAHGRCRIFKMRTTADSPPE